LWVGGAVIFPNAMYAVGLFPAVFL
jgi:hypothetical protein